MKAQYPTLPLHPPGLWRNWKRETEDIASWTVWVGLTAFTVAACEKANNELRSSAAAAFLNDPLVARQKT
jgi:hypothetical protein